MSQEDNADYAAGLGNFKGVMLCNRPDVGVGVANRPDQYEGRMMDPTEKQPFFASVSMGALEPLGLLRPQKGDRVHKKVEMLPAQKTHKEKIKQIQVR